MTLDCTRPLRILIDWGAFDPATAKPYSTCFNVGDWFKWNFPEKTGASRPPCLVADLGGITTYSEWVQGTQNVCYPGQDRTSSMCDRRLDPTGQNCWGVCLEEDVLRAQEPVENLVRVRLG